MRPLRCAHATFLLVPMVLLAGCAAPAASVDTAAAEDTATATLAPWKVEAEGSLGWVAGAGLHVFAADLIVGVRSHDQCPRVSWVVPAQVDTMTIVVAEGAGPIKLALGEPAGVTYMDQVDGAEAQFHVLTPDEGIWSLELKPEGVALPQTRALTLTLEGSGTAPTLVLQPDVDCLL